MQVKLAVTLLLAIATVANGQNELCGGLAIQSTGEIVYKPGYTYNNYEACTWTVRSGLATNLRFTLLQDGFETCCDYITIATFEDYDTANISVQAELRAGNRQPVVVNGPVAFVTFRTDGSVTGTGFRLRFESFGISSRKDLEDLLFSHRAVYPTGASVVRYPATDISYRSFEFVTYVIQPPRIPNQPAQSNFILEQVDIEESVDCVNDALDINSAEYTLIPLGRVCRENWNGTEISSSSGIFILVFRSNANEQRRGFRGTFLP